VSAAGHRDVQAGGFSASRERFDTVLAFLDGTDAAVLSHSPLEDRLDVEGRELLHQLFQDHLGLRAVRESRVEVTDTDGVGRTRVETGHTRGLGTIFGEVAVTRLAYRTAGRPNLHLADATLNLPTEKHSHGLRHLAAVEAARGSFDGAVKATARTTGQQVGTRPVEHLAQRSAVDVDDFYTHHQVPTGDPGDVLVLSCDGKGVVMRPGALRTSTARAAAKTNPKLQTRLSTGEKRNRKRMAEVGAVHDTTPTPRTPTDILPRHRRRAPRHHPRTPGRQQTAGHQPRPRRRVRRRSDLRRNRPPRPHTSPHPGGAHRRQQPPDRPDHRPSHGTHGADHDHHRLHPRPGTPVKGHLVLPHRSRPRHRGLGTPPRPENPHRRRHPSHRHHPTRRHQSRPRAHPPRQHRHLRHLPDQQARLPRLPHRPHTKPADRHRRHQKAPAGT